MVPASAGNISSVKNKGGRTIRRNGDTIGKRVIHMNIGSTAHDRNVMTNGPTAKRYEAANYRRGRFPNDLISVYHTADSVARERIFRKKA